MTPTVDPRTVLANLCTHLAQGRVTFRAAFNVAGLGDDAIARDVLARWPDVLVLDFGMGGTKDEQVVGDRFEFNAAFFSTFGGDRFFSLPVDRLIDLRDVRIAGLEPEAVSEADQQRSRFAGRDAGLEAAARAAVESEDLRDWAAMQESKPSNVVPFKRPPAPRRRGDS